MAALLHVAEIEIKNIRRDYCLVRVLVQNVGSRVLTPGALLARQVVSEGTVRSIEFFHTVSLAPNDQTRLTQLLSGSLKSIEFKGYRETRGALVPVTGLTQRSVLSFTEAGERFVKEFLVPVCQSITARIHKIQLPKRWVKKAGKTETTGGSVSL